MANKMQLEIGDAIKSVKAGNIDPVYVLLGNDCYLEQKFIEEVETGFFPDGAVQKSMLLPEELKESEIIDRLTAIDLFSSKQLFVLRKPSGLKGKKIKAEFLEYIENPQTEKCLIIIIDDWSDKSALVKKIKDTVGFINISTPFESKLKSWVLFMFREKGRTDISPNVVNALIEIAGDSLYHIANEIDKVCTVLKEDAQITPDDIYKFSGWKRGFQSWQFLTAVGERDLFKSVQIGHDLLARTSTITQLVNALANLFQEILYQKIGSGTKSAAKGYTGLSPSLNKKLPQFAKGYRRDEIERNLKLLGSIDEEIKTTSVSDEYALTRFLFSALAAHG